jgi:Family of unknown function (DUF6030)
MAGRIRTAYLAILAVVPYASLGQTIAPPIVRLHDNWFDHPEILCRALEPQGFPAGPWRQLAPNSPVYQCEYPLLSANDPSRRRAAADRITEPPHISLFFQVSGGYPNQADRIAICITINAPDDMQEAKRQMLIYIRSLYDAIGQSVPGALVAYVGQEKHYLSHQPYGIVSFFPEHRRDRRPEQLLWFRLGKNPQ